MRDRSQSHFLTPRIPVEPAALDELLARAEKESLSHLRFLDLLLGTQADARRERAVVRRIRDAHFAENKTLEGFNWEFNPKASDRVQIEELATAPSSVAAPISSWLAGAAWARVTLFRRWGRMRAYKVIAFYIGFLRSYSRT